MNKKIISTILIVSMVFNVIIPNFSLYANRNDGATESKIVEQLKTDLGEEKAKELLDSSEYTEQYTYVSDDVNGKDTGEEDGPNEGTISFDADNNLSNSDGSMNEVINPENTDNDGNKKGDYFDEPEGDEGQEEDNDNAEGSSNENPTEPTSESLNERTQEANGSDATTQSTEEASNNVTNESKNESITESSNETTMMLSNSNNATESEIIEEYIEDLATYSNIAKVDSSDAMNANNIFGLPDVKIYWGFKNTYRALYLSMAENDIPSYVDQKGDFPNTTVFSSKEEVPWHSYRSMIKNVICKTQYFLAKCNLQKHVKYQSIVNCLLIYSQLFLIVHNL